MFSFLLILLVMLLTFIQTNIWTGTYSFSNLKDLKNELKEKKQISSELEKKNLNLIQQKNLLKSERNAIEGLARSQLGLIKPGEMFYRFEYLEDKDAEIDLIKKEINE